jgi:hypothetical protein
MSDISKQILGEDIPGLDDMGINQDEFLDSPSSTIEFKLSWSWSSAGINAGNDRGYQEVYSCIVEMLGQIFFNLKPGTISENDDIEYSDYHHDGDKFSVVIYVTLSSSDKVTTTFNFIKNLDLAAIGGDLKISDVKINGKAVKI